MNSNNNTETVIAKHEATGKYIDVEGVKTFVLEKGSGEAVFCIHGVPTSSFLYRKLVNSLAGKGYRAIAVDLPGLGLSSRPNDFEYTFSSFAAFLSKVMIAMELEKIHLVVHDIGGPIGFALAANNRERINSLTILNTWIDVENFQKPLVMRPFENKILGEAELAMISHTTWPVMFSKMGVNTIGNIPPGEVKAYVDLLKQEDKGKAFLKIMRNFQDSEEFRKTCYSAVRNVPYPVQAIWGKDDPALTVDRYGKEIKEVASLKELHLLPGKHFLQEEVFEEIAVLIDKQARKLKEQDK